MTSKFSVSSKNISNYFSYSFFSCSFFSWFSLGLLLVLSGCASTTKVSDKKTDATLVEWTSQESQDRFARAQAKADFFVLSNHFTSQDNGIFCGLASSSIVLNALQLGSDKIPQDKSSIQNTEAKYLPEGYNPFFAKYTQNNVLNKNTKSKLAVLGEPIDIKGEKKKDYGLQLEQLAQVLSANGAKVRKAVVSDELEAEKIKNDLITNLSNAADFVLVNYKRSELGQKGGGHISPLGGYDKKSDSFLIMDVNPNKAPWVWVKADTLIKAMRTFDTVENRGYVVVQ